MKYGKVIKVGIPVIFANVSNEEIRQAIRESKKYLGDIASLYRDFDSIGHTGDTEHITKAIRLDEDLTDTLRTLSGLAGSSQTALSSKLVLIHLKRSKADERVRDELIRQLESLGYVVTIEERGE